MNKKSLSLFIDSLDVLDDLTDEQAGQLFKAIREYEVNEKETLSGLMKAIFVPFKNGIDREKEAYKNQVARNKANGKKGGRPKSEDNPKNPVGFSETQQNPQKAYNEEEEEKEEEKEYIPAKMQEGIEEKFSLIWKAYSLDFLGKKFGRRGGDKQKARKNFFALLAKGYTLEQIAGLIRAEHSLNYPRDLERVLLVKSMKQHLEDMEIKNAS